MQVDHKRVFDVGQRENVPGKPPQKNGKKTHKKDNMPMSCCRAERDLLFFSAQHGRADRAWAAQERERGGRTAKIQAQVQE